MEADRKGELNMRVFLDYKKFLIFYQNNLKYL